MQLVGMLDSPYVRRVAISLRLLGLPFEHRSVSVFSSFTQFQQINPVVKAPTLVCADGVCLMDSTLILDYAESLSNPVRSLVPTDPPARRRDLQLQGLALAACEKTVQIVYERNLRPEEKQHAPWLERVGGQLAAAYAELEAELARAPLQSDIVRPITQAGVTAAVAWSFTQMLLPGQISITDHPHLATFTTQAEKLPAFLAMPAA